MFYTKEYIFDKLKEKLNNINISNKEQKGKTIYVVDYKGHKLNIDIDTFITRLDDNQSEKSDKKVEELIFYIENNLLAQNKFSLDKISKEDFLKNIFPVVRATTFAKNSKERLISKEHTNETKIFYSLDLGNSYRLISEDILSYYDVSKEELDNLAQSNLQNLPLKYNTDIVADNIFYFINAKDGYDGSRILNDEVLKYFYNKIGSDFYLGIPNQDSLVIADIKNKKGLEILQKIMVHFFTDGLVPITTITFKYDNQKLENLFIFVE